MTGFTEDHAAAMLHTTEPHVLRLLAVGDLTWDGDSVLAQRKAAERTTAAAGR